MFHFDQRKTISTQLTVMCCSAWILITFSQKSLTNNDDVVNAVYILMNTIFICYLKIIWAYNYITRANIFDLEIFVFYLFMYAWVYSIIFFFFGNKENPQVPLGLTLIICKIRLFTNEQLGLNCRLIMHNAGLFIRSLTRKWEFEQVRIFI